MFNKIIKGGELLPAAPLQPCAEAPSGRRSYRICWTLLTWPNDIMPAMHFHVRTMPPPPPPPCSTGMRHPLGMAPCTEAPHSVIIRRWVLSELCWYIPCPTLPTKEYCVFFVSARHNINPTRLLGLALLNFARHCPIYTTRFEMVTDNSTRIYYGRPCLHRTGFAMFFLDT